MQTSRQTLKAILALGLIGAFDNVIHQAIYVNLNGLTCGNRKYNYLRDILSGRKFIIHIGDIASDPIELGGRGTPQAAVPLAVLFNIALTGLPAKLVIIPICTMACTPTI